MSYRIANLQNNSLCLLLNILRNVWHVVFSRFSDEIKTQKMNTQESKERKFVDKKIGKG